MRERRGGRGRRQRCTEMEPGSPTSVRARPGAQSIGNIRYMGWGSDPSEPRSGTTNDRHARCVSRLSRRRASRRNRWNVRKAYRMPPVIRGVRGYAVVLSALCYAILHSAICNSRALDYGWLLRFLCPRRGRPISYYATRGQPTSLLCRTTWRHL